MAVVFGPLFSFSASGTIARALDYYPFRNIFVARGMFTPAISDKEVLLQMRNYMRSTVWTWQHLSDNIPPLWDDWAKDYEPSWSGYNSFTSYYLLDLYSGLLPSLFPPT